MAEEQQYSLKLENGEMQASSRDYTGKATATYKNGDTYEGEFVDGVR